MRHLILGALIALAAAALLFLLDPSLFGMLRQADSHWEPFADASGGAAAMTKKHAPDASGGKVTPPAAGAGAKSAPATVHPASAATGATGASAATAPPAATDASGGAAAAAAAAAPSEAFANASSVPAPQDGTDAAGAAALCAQRDVLSPDELLPNDPNSRWAQVNPPSEGSLAQRNYLSAGALFGIDTVGQSLRNANYQLRSDPPCPQINGITPWNVSTITPDVSHRPLEIG